MVDLCRNMIVKNEAHIIERCLKAARPHGRLAQRPRIEANLKFCLDNLK